MSRRPRAGRGGAAVAVAAALAVARRQAATLRSGEPLRVEGFFDVRPVGEGEATFVDFEPAGARVLRLHRLAEE